MANRPDFTFRAVQVFVAIVEAGSVTRAAQRLGMSPSSTSQQLANLEAALESRLVERTARLFRLTASGTLFLRRARALLDDVSAAKAELALADEAPRMALRVATIEEFDADVTPHWLAALEARLPNVAFSISSGASHENHDALANRAADLVLAVDGTGTAVRSAARSVDWVESHDILRDAFVLAIRADRAPVSDLAELSDVPFLRYASDLHIGRQIETALRRARIRPAPHHDFTTNRALFAVLARQGGWAVTTASAGLYAGEGVRIAPLPLPGFSRRLALHTRRGAFGALPALMAGQLRSSIAEAMLPRVAAVPALSEDALIVLHSDPVDPHR